jgi:hypothetical protein
MTDTTDTTPDDHMSEREYADHHVRPWLEARYGAENVRQEVVLAASDRRADFLAETDLVTWAIEVENDAHAVIGGVAQALLYAAHRPEWRPCVITPPGHFEQPERDMLDEHVRIIEVPIDSDGA